jgi:hypothetical protein
MLRRFQDDGLIAVRRRQVEIRDFDALKRMAESMLPG